MSSCSFLGTEVRLNLTDTNDWKEITLPSGSGGTLDSIQGLKITERAGEYTLTKRFSSTQSFFYNRFVYWRSHHDTLELIEESFDCNLIKNRVRYRFLNSPILNVSIHEHPNEVVILVSTLFSVHRLLFPHPRITQRNVKQISSEDKVQSIFSDASSNDSRLPSNFYSLSNSAGIAYNLHASSSCLLSDGEALFSMATDNGTIILIKLPSKGSSNCIPSVHEMKNSSMMQRIWAGFVPSVLSRSPSSSEMVYSLQICSAGSDHILFSICKDHKLRIWSVKKLDCLLIENMADYLPSLDIQKLHTRDAHVIKCAVDTKNHSVVIAVYLSFKDRPQFVVFRFEESENQPKLTHLMNIMSSSDDMIDFDLSSSQLWAVWTNSQGEYVGRTILLSSSVKSKDWFPVYLYRSLNSEIQVPSNKDPRETYIHELFYSGLFNHQSIMKAVQIYHKNFDHGFNIKHSISMEMLRDEVISIVEHEIQAAACDYEMNDADFCHLQLQHWANFYCCCVQYQQVCNKVLSLVANEDTGLVYLIKKDNMSYIKSCNFEEYLYCAPENTDHSYYSYVSAILPDQSDHCVHDLVILLECVKAISSCLTEEIIYEFEQDLFYGSSPRSIAQQILNSFLSDNGQNEDIDRLLRDIEMKLCNIHNVLIAVQNLINLLDCSSDFFKSTESSFIDGQYSYLDLFSSHHGIAFLSGAISKRSQVSLSLSRDLLLLLTFVNQIYQKVGFSLSVYEELSTGSIESASNLVQMYHLICWCSKTLVSPVKPNMIEFNLRQLETLEIKGVNSLKITSSLEQKNFSLIELFLISLISEAKKEFLPQQDITQPTQILSYLLNKLMQALWPADSAIMMAKCLVFHCQFLQAQEYIRLTSTSCVNNHWLFNMLLGQCFLNCNESYKALDCFCVAAHGVKKDPFLNDFLPFTDNISLKSLQVEFFLKIIKLFEQFSMSDLILSLAKKAIIVADDQDENKAILWSKMFKYHLELGHNTEAYNAMSSNPDPSRLKDCLRQFLVVLCKRQELQTLVEFSYTNLEDEVVNILESRARTVDLLKQNYYDVLYSFHIFRGNYRKAGSVMYEYGSRLSREMLDLKSLQKQAKCLLATLNILKLVDPNYAWIVQPAFLKGEVEEKMDVGLKTKENQITNQLDVIELADIEKQYILLHSRLSLYQTFPDSFQVLGSNCSQQETVSLLVNAGMFDHAIKIYQLFDISLVQVFETLAFKCVKLAQSIGNMEYTAQAVKWIDQNEITGCPSAKEVSPADRAWGLLQSYLKKYQKPSAIYHRTVAVRLLSQVFALPNWLTVNYKLLDPAELLRLYIDYDLLEEAWQLTMEYIDAVLGKGTEYFCIKATINVTSSSVWLPYTSIDRLLEVLKQMEDNVSYLKLSEQLRDKISVYHQTVRQVSQDKLIALKS